MIDCTRAKARLAVLRSAPGIHYDEFIATPTAANICRTQCLGNHFGQMNERGIANCMAMLVIDVLEIVQIEKNHCKRLAGPLRTCRFTGKYLLQSSTIKSAGQWVMAGVLAGFAQR